MAVGHDTSQRFPDSATAATVDTTTGDRTFSHGGAAGARGALVIILNNAAADPVTGVLYGGTAMSLVASATDTSEPARIQIWFLGDLTGLTGTQTVTLQGATAVAKVAYSCTVTAATSLTAADNTGVVNTTTSADPTVAFTTVANARVYGAVVGGFGTPTSYVNGASVTAVTGTNSGVGGDFGANSGRTAMSSAATSAGSFTFNFTGVSDDWAVAAVSVKEPAAVSVAAAGGLATASGTAIALSSGYPAAAGAATASGGAATASSTSALSAAGGLATAAGGTVGCAATLAVVGAGYRTAVLATSGLVGYWRFGEPSGTSANDEVGTNDGTLAGGATFGGAGALAGDSNTAVSLDGGANGNVSFANPSLTAPFSLEAWIYNTGPGSVGASTWAAVFGASSTRRLLFDTGDNDGRVLAQMGGTDPMTGTDVVTQNAWFHVVYTYGSGLEKIYVNGVEQASVSAASGPSWNSAFFVGSTANPAGSYAFKGRIDEPAVYSVALSAGTVAAHYAAGLTAAGNVASGGSVSLATLRVAAAGVATAGGGALTLAASLVAAGGTSAASGGAATATTGAGVTVSATNGTATATGTAPGLSRTHLAASGVATAGGGAVNIAAAGTVNVSAVSGTSTATGGLVAETWRYTASGGAAAASGGTVFRTSLAAGGVANATGGTVAARLVYTSAGGMALAAGGVANAAGAAFIPFGLIEGFGGSGATVDGAGASSVTGSSWGVSGTVDGTETAGTIVEGTGGVPVLVE